jgi:hypothetical protein
MTIKVSVYNISLRLWIFKFRSDLHLIGRSSGIYSLNYLRILVFILIFILSLGLSLFIISPNTVKRNKQKNYTGNATNYYYWQKGKAI